MKRLNSNLLSGGFLRLVQNVLFGITLLASSLPVLLHWTPPLCAVLGTMSVCLLWGVSAKHQKAQQVLLQRRSREALVDTLTEARNRRAFEEDIEQLLASSERNQDTFAVAFVDMDYLKTINDTKGHEAGDDAIASVASALRAASRAGDRVYRLGGDEFALLLPDSDLRGALTSIDRAKEILSSLASINGPVNISSGVACYPEDGEDSRTLLQVADSWVYRAKRSRPGVIQPRIRLTGSVRASRTFSSVAQPLLALD